MLPSIKDWVNVRTSPYFKAFPTTSSQFQEARSPTDGKHLGVHRSIISDWLGLYKCTHKNNPKFQASHAGIALRAWVQLHLFVMTVILESLLPQGNLVGISVDLFETSFGIVFLLKYFSRRAEAYEEELFFQLRLLISEWLRLFYYFPENDSS